MTSTSALPPPDPATLVAGMAPPILARRKSLKMIHDDFEYYTHQLRGIRQMAGMTGCLLADEMGLGKTVQGITVAALAVQRGEGCKFLVVCPATLKENWAEELDNYTYFKYTIVPNGSKYTKAKRSLIIEEFRGSDSHFLLMNYEQVVSHLSELNSIGFAVAFYDEGQAIKGRKSKRTKACHKLRIKRNFVLTGSPMLNQVDDLWAILHRIDPVEWPSYWTFVNRYALYGGYMDKQIVGIKNEAELRERLARYMIRRTKEECLDLPDKVWIKIVLELYPEQRKLYDQLKDELKIDLPNNPTPFEVETNMEKVLRFKQICGTTAVLPGQPDVSVKLDRAMEIIEELRDDGKSVVVFTQFRAILGCMNTRLETAGIPVWTLHGDIPAAMRRPMIKDWTMSHNQGEPGVLTCMFQVGGIGLTMTAAHHCIFLDKLYAPLLNDQAADRLHRIGQTDTVFIHDLVAKNTYDSIIGKILTQKEGIFGRVVDQDSSDWKRQLLQRITEEDE